MLYGDTEVYKPLFFATFKSFLHIKKIFNRRRQPKQWQDNVYDWTGLGLSSLNQTAVNPSGGNKSLMLMRSLRVSV